jgi:serine phosphatase RsbU (regulator of sigma subunit)
VENSDGHQFGEERLNSLLCCHQNTAIEAIPDILLKEVQQFSGKPELADDFTVIGLRKL